MNIAFLLDDSLDRPDGVQQYILTLGNWMQQHGHTVHYLTSGDDYVSQAPNVHVLTKNIPVSFNRNTLCIPKPVRKQRINQFFRDNKIDVVHAQLPHNPVFAGRVMRHMPSDIPLVGTFHVAPFGGLETVFTRLLRVLYTRSLSRFSCIISVSELAKDYADKIYRPLSIVIPNAIDTAKFQVDRDRINIKKKTEVEIRFLGRLVERKGCQFLLEAVNEAARSNPDLRIHVTVGGKGPLSSRLKEYTNKHGLQEIVSFSGFVSEKDKPSFFAEADIVAFPSTGGESFGIVLVEAMASGNSVVLAGDNPGYSRVMGMSEALIDPYDIQEFSEKIATYARDKKLRASVAEKQRKRAKEFDINVIGPKLLNVYAAARKETR